MSIEKFIYLLQEKSLYFTQAKKMAEKYDVHEGKYKKEFLEMIKTHSELVTRNERKETDSIYPIAPIDKDDFKDLSLSELNTNYLSCWHINEIEFDFMWKLYADRNLGLAIQTTFKKLCECFILSDYEITLFKIDYQKIPDYNIRWNPIAQKREHYKPEHELRAIVCCCSEDEGIPIEVDLNILIDNIYLKPKTKTHQVKIIKKLVSKYCLNKEVLRSTIDDEPEY